MFLSCFSRHEASDHRFKNENVLVPPDVSAALGLPAERQLLLQLRLLFRLMFQCLN